eukprot:14854806-Heterocapsa_arctica.AAC.1
MASPAAGHIFASSSSAPSCGLPSACGGASDGNGNACDYAIIFSASNSWLRREGALLARQGRLCW